MLDIALGIGGQLLGGLLGNRSAKKAAAQQRAWALEDHRMQWVRHREASELGGFNPLATLGMGQGVAATPVSSNNYMGDAVASAGLMLADSVAKTRAAQAGRQVEDLNRQREVLQRKLRDATLRPTVPGIFDRARNFGIPPAPTGATNANSGSNPDMVRSSGPLSGRPDNVGAPSVRPLLDTDPVDPRRGVENKPVASGPGVMVVDNAYLPRLYFPTIDGDEPLDVLDIPSFAAAVPQIGYHYGQYTSYGGGRESRPSLTREEALRLKRERDAATARQRREIALRPHTLRFNPSRADAYYRPGFQ